MPAIKKTFLFATTLFLLICTSTANADPDRPETYRGVLVSTYAVGNNTEGWVILLDQPVQLDGTFRIQLPIDQRGIDLMPFEGMVVDATGVVGLRKSFCCSYFPIVLLSDIRAVGR